MTSKVRSTLRGPALDNHSFWFYELFSGKELAIRSGVGRHARPTQVQQ